MPHPIADGPDRAVPPGHREYAPEERHALLEEQGLLLVLLALCARHDVDQRLIDLALGQSS